LNVKNFKKEIQKSCTEDERIMNIINKKSSVMLTESNTNFLKKEEDKNS